MKKIELTLYNFSELSPESKKKALDKARELEYIEPELLEESFRDILLEEYGICGCGEIKIYWSLNHCQGDGVAFYGKPDVDKLLEKHEELRNLLAQYPRDEYDPQLCIKIESNNSHYNHYNTMKVDFEVEEVDRRNHPFTCDQIDSRVEHFLKEVFKDASRRLEKVGYEEIEYRTSDAYLTERLEDLGDTFLESGRLYHE